MLARAPFTLLAAIDAPTPLPQTRTPAVRVAHHHALSHGLREVRVVVSGIVGVGAEVDDLVAETPQQLDKRALQRKTRVVCTDRDAYFSCMTQGAPSLPQLAGLAGSRC